MNWHRAAILAAMVLLAALALSGCGSTEPTRLETAVETVPEFSPPPAPTRTPKPTPIPSATPEPPTSTPDLADLVKGLSALESANLGQMTWLGAQSLLSTGEAQEFTGLDWSDDGRWVVTCSREESASFYRVFDLEQGTQQSEAVFPSSACGDALWKNRWLQFSRDGSMFLGLTAPPHWFDENHPEGPAVIHSQAGELLALLEVPPADFPGEMGVVERAAFSSQGTRLALSVYYPALPASTQDASVEGGAWIEYRTAVLLYDVQTGAIWGTFQKLMHWELLDLAYSTAGDYLLTASFDGVEAWNVDNGSLANQIDCPAASITFSPTAEIAALACEPRVDDPYQLLWDPVSGAVNPLTGAPGSDFLDLSFSPDGRMLIGLSKTGLVSIWHGVSGEHLYTLPETYPDALDVHFTHGGRAVTILSTGGRLDLFGAR